jgi:hypothetical protein
MKVKKNRTEFIGLLIIIMLVSGNNFRMGECLMNIGYRLVLVLLVWAVAAENMNPDETEDRKQLFESLRFKPDRNNTQISFHNASEIYIKPDGTLAWNHPSDRIYPNDSLLVQVNTLFPLIKGFGIGPSFLTEHYFKLSHPEGSDPALTALNFNSVFLPGFTFYFYPHHPGLDIPLMMIAVEAGPAVELSNVENDGDGLHWKAGGYTAQTLILPAVPVHLYLFDTNVLAVMATRTPAGWYPGILYFNIFLMKFEFFNFAVKQAKSGLRIRNRFRFILTGKPDLYDLTSQYTYNRFESTLYFGGVPGFQIHLGFAHEYITFARDPEWHQASKLVGEMNWEKKGLTLTFRYLLAFWDDGFLGGVPVHEFYFGAGYRLGLF